MATQGFQPIAVKNEAAAIKREMPDVMSSVAVAPVPLSVDPDTVLRRASEAELTAQHAQQQMLQIQAMQQQIQMLGHIAKMQEAMMAAQGIVAPQEAGVEASRPSGRQLKVQQVARPPLSSMDLNARTLHPALAAAAAQAAAAAGPAASAGFFNMVPGGMVAAPHPSGGYMLIPQMMAQAHAQQHAAAQAAMSQCKPQQDIEGQRAAAAAVPPLQFYHTLPNGGLAVMPGAGASPTSPSTTDGGSITPGSTDGLSPGGLSLPSSGTKREAEKPSSRTPSPAFGGPGKGGAESYSRKDKSLGLLCDKFFTLCASMSDDLICLDKAANQLVVERRRIYDIVNVLESLEIVVRQKKSLYKWHGFERVPLAIAKLNTCDWAADFDVEEGEGDDKEDGDKSAGASADGSRPGSPSSDESEAMRCLLDLAKKAKEDGKEKASKKVDSRRQRSLGLLSRRFIRLFLARKTLSLDDAAFVLTQEEGGNVDPAAPDLESKLKTKVRRLYDIANILMSLNLVQKLSRQEQSRKPEFTWVGMRKHDHCLARQDSAGEAGTQGDEAAPPSKKRRASLPRAEAELVAAEVGAAVLMGGWPQSSS